MTSNVVTYEHDRAYASSRIRSTVVRKKSNGRPVYVDDVSSSGSCGVKDLNSISNWETVDVTDLDFEPLPLGYVNKGRNTAYAGRRPTRHYKQGLNDHNLFFVGHKVSGVNASSKHLVKTIMGQYPSAEDCYEAIVCEEADGRAFSRDFALGKTRGGKVTLNYRSQTVVGQADITETGLVLSLKPEYEYLSESLEEACK